MTVIGRMTSNLGNHVAGTGIYLAFDEKEEFYRDKKVRHVKMPHDYAMGNDNYASLSGEVITYNLNDLEGVKENGETSEGCS